MRQTLLNWFKRVNKSKRFKIGIDLTRLTKENVRNYERAWRKTVTPIVKLAKVDSKDNFDNKAKFLDNPLDLLDQEKLMGDLERKRSLFQGRIHDKSNEVKAIEHIYEKTNLRAYWEKYSHNDHRAINSRKYIFEESQ